MRILALDIGKKRIGVAVTDPLEITVRPHTTLVRNRSIFDILAQMIQDLEVGKVVVGLPLHLDGTESEQAKDVRLFAERLSQQIGGVEVKLWDERLTSVEAEQRMAELKIDPKKRREKRDAFAASILLESYLSEK